VQFAKEHCVPFRLDRDNGRGKEFFDKHKLETKKPAILVFDSEGELLYKTQRCVNPNDCLKGMQQARTLMSSRAAYAKTAAKKFTEIEKWVQAQNYDDALAALNRFKPQLLGLSLRGKVEEQLRAIEKAGSEKLEQAKQLEERKDYDRAGSLYREVLKSFARLDKVENQAKEGLQRLKRTQKAA
jgi:hypothetical protein